MRDKHQDIEEPCEFSGSCTVLKSNGSRERVVDFTRSTHDCQKFLFQNLNSQGNGINKRILELDIEKCFDRISHNFLQKGERVFAGLQVGEQRVLPNKRWVWGRQVYVVATRLANGELLILATNDDPETVLVDYRLRWGIETLFAALKTRGFNLESTHFCHRKRLNKLVALLALAFCWAMLTGLWQHGQRPIPLKKHRRRAKSLFRYGFDFWRRTFSDFSLRCTEFTQVLQLLSPY